jgi:GNAT superfamily N-acetyltransferase
VPIRNLDQPGDLGWMVQAHGEIYAAEYGWDRSFETLVAGIVARFAEDHDPDREAAWVAVDDTGRRVGCVMCVRVDDRTAQLRVLLVDPSARGTGVGGALVDTCVRFARTAGFAVLKLWTTDPLTAARGLYLSRGFLLVEEKPAHEFGVDLVTQVYELEL